MMTGRLVRMAKRKREAMTLPTSPYDFEETVRRVLSAPPPPKKTRRKSGQKKRTTRT